MSNNKVKLDAIDPKIGANSTRFSEVAGARVDNLQQQHAGLDNVYQVYLYGGNDINDYYTGAESLNQETMIANVLKSYNRDVASGQIPEAKAGTDAYKAMSEIAKG